MHSSNCAKKNVWPRQTLNFAINLTILTDILTERIRGYRLTTGAAAGVRHSSTLSFAALSHAGINTPLPHCTGQPSNSLDSRALPYSLSLHSRSLPLRYSYSDRTLSTLTGARPLAAHTIRISLESTYKLPDELFVAKL